MGIAPRVQRILLGVAILVVGVALALRWGVLSAADKVLLFAVMGFMAFLVAFRRRA